MDAAILANIGNSRSEFARWERGRVHEREQGSTAEFLSGHWQPRLARENGGLPRLAACVVPSARRQLDQVGGWEWLTWQTAVDLDFSAVDPRTVGADRLANAVAAINELPLPAIVIDCGTAITVEVVDRKRRFLGGAIMAGRRLARQALAGGTGQLPMLPDSMDLPDAIGTTTRAAMRAGIDRGAIGAVQRLLDDTREALGRTKLPGTVVGGDRSFFANNLDGVQEGPEDWTLRGLAWVLRRR